MKDVDLSNLHNLLREKTQHLSINPKLEEAYKNGLEKSEKQYQNQFNEIIRQNSVDVPHFEDLVALEKNKLDEISTALAVKADKIFVSNHLKNIKYEIHESQLRIQDMEEAILSIKVNIM